MRIVCWLIGIWRTLTMQTGFIPVSGHQLTAAGTAFKDGLMWSALVCDRCGHVVWGWEPLRPVHPNWRDDDYKPLPPTAVTHKPAQPRQED